MRLERLILGQGAPTAMGVFFGPDACKVRSVAHDAQGDLKVVWDYPQRVGYMTNERVLGKERPVGWSSAWADRYSMPLGCWTRRDGAWESACVYAQPDAGSPLADSMLVLRVGDDGKSSMVLWERLRGDAGGIFYRLDAEKWLQHPEQAPAVLEMAPYLPGEPARAPFYEPPAPAAGPSDWAQFFGPSAPDVKITRFEPNEYVKSGAAQVDLEWSWGWMRTVHGALHKDIKPGTVVATHAMEDQLFLSWTRTAEGWVCETKARPLPEHFDGLRDVVLHTEIDEDARLLGMFLRAEGRDGSRVEYVLDGSDYVLGRSREPRVVDVRRTEAPPRPLTPEPLQPEVPRIHDEGDWVIIGDVRVQKRP